MVITFSASALVCSRQLYAVELNGQRQLHGYTHPVVSRFCAWPPARRFSLGKEPTTNIKAACMTGLHMQLGNSGELRRCGLSPIGTNVPSRYCIKEKFKYSSSVVFFFFLLISFQLSTSIHLSRSRKLWNLLLLSWTRSVLFSLSIGTVFCCELLGGWCCQ